MEERIRYARLPRPVVTNMHISLVWYVYEAWSNHRRHCHVMQGMVDLRKAYIIELRKAWSSYTSHGGG